MKLERYIELKEELNYISLMIEELKTQLYKIKSNIITDLPKGSIKELEDERVLQLIQKIEAKSDLYYKKYDECLNELNNILEVIEKLNGIEKSIITEKYINNSTWDKISKKTNYSRMQLYRIHKKVIEKINMV